MIFIGDVHGKWNELAAQIDRADIRNECLVQVGDFGIGFWERDEEEAQLGDLVNTLAERGCMLYAIRGNHDDPTAFTGRYDLDNGEIETRLHLVPDYTVIHHGGMAALLVGGAISVDRAHRMSYKASRPHATRHGSLILPGADWWPGEPFVWDRERLNAALVGVGHLDVVATHSAPAFCHPTSKSGIQTFIDRDPALAADCDKERGDLHAMALALDQLKLAPARWFYGHFHISHWDVFGETAYVALAELEMREYRP